ncbi:MAG: hypothetical protein ISR65_08030 [Bacteriovoracaceae bacterium]|nr:hypothetical protein [Bacteriovoracaceae bacterium]
MKSFSKLIFIFCCLSYIPNLCARDIILVTYKTKLNKAKLVKKILEQTIHIPDRLINLRATKKPCLKKNEVILQICIQENDSVHFPVIQKATILNSFKIFQKVGEEKKEEIL